MSMTCEVADDPETGREHAVQPVALAHADAHSSASVLDRAARRALLARLDKLRGGRIHLHDGRDLVRLGDGDALAARVDVLSPRFYRRAVLGGSLAIAESYLAGEWACDDLTSLFRIFLRDGGAGRRADGPLTRLFQLGNRIVHRLRPNTRSGSRKNIEAHYDLGNDFFQLLLDETLAYSSGIFPTPHATLHEASIEKIDRLCRKLDLRPGDQLLEIGTGWGGLALHAAAHYGCRVTTTTISRRQFDLAKRRAADAGLSDKITFLLRDYRDLTGRFDKLVSVEMLEAVGRRYFDVLFAACGRLLKPDGSAVLQTITIPESRFARYVKSVDFIQRYVFPGGCLPSVGAVLESVGRASELRFVHAEDFGPHYARTLREWRDRFEGRLSEVRALGYDDEFIRLWRYYLSYCEAAFEERAIGVVQLQFDGAAARRDPLDVGRAAAREISPSVAEVRA